MTSEEPPIESVKPTTKTDSVNHAYFAKRKSKLKSGIPNGNAIHGNDFIDQVFS